MTTAFPSMLSKAQSGDHQAFAELWRATNPRVLAYVRSFVDAQTAEDIVADAWVDIARNLTTFTGEQPAFTGWVFTIVRRRMMDRSRRLSAERRRFEAARTEAAFCTGQADLDAANIVHGDLSSRDAIAFVTANLPDAQAEVVILRVMAGLDIEAVAEITGQLPGTIRVLQHRALKRLNNALSGTDAHDAFGGQTEKSCRGVENHTTV